MDPYLEEPGIWSDFHTTFYVAIRAELNARLPAGYVARIDRYVWIEEPEVEQRVRLGAPDVLVSTDNGGGSGAVGAALLAAPATIVLPAVRREGSRYLKIIDSRDRRVVTVVEVLSPTNKLKGKDRDAYLAKRNEYLASEINLVEIDLLRSWERMPMGDSPAAPADYLVLVSRASEFPRAGLWSISVRDPLPEIPIPLTPQEPDVSLPLRTCFDRAFEEGRYYTEIDYAKPPIPPLTEPNASWARELLAHRAHGHR
jgi:hypothetical protein